MVKKEVNLIKARMTADKFPTIDAGLKLIDTQINELNAERIALERIRARITGEMFED